MLNKCYYIVKQVSRLLFPSVEAAPIFPPILSHLKFKARKQGRKIKESCGILKEHFRQVLCGEVQFKDGTEGKMSASGCSHIH
jgi:hypothetical protein